MQHEANAGLADLLITVGPRFERRSAQTRETLRAIHSRSSGDWRTRSTAVCSSSDSTTSSCSEAVRKWSIRSSDNAARLAASSSHTRRSIVRCMSQPMCDGGRCRAFAVSWRKFQACCLLHFVSRVASATFFRRTAALQPWAQHGTMELNGSQVSCALSLATTQASPGCSTHSLTGTDTQRIVLSALGRHGKDPAGLCQLQGA